MHLYTRRWCGYCFAARRLLKKLMIDFDEIPLDGKAEFRRSLSEANNNWPTLPMVFVGERFVGGYTDLVRLHRRGGLKSLLEGAA